MNLYEQGGYLVNETTFIPDGPDAAARLQAMGLSASKAEASKETISYGILQAHNDSQDPESYSIKFDAMASHDITFVGIVQTARAGGLKEFPVPYVLTCCHNSLCAVGGTINEDDHLFGLSAAQKYGGIFVPAHLAVIHQYMRECMAGCGKMILGSDSHTRYGALGTMAMGEGGPELVKQLLGQRYLVAKPKIVGILLKGAPKPGVGPQDVALALIGKVFASGFVKNCVLEFVGEGVNGLSVDYRCGIDVMTTETTCLSSIWSTDDKVKDYFALRGRPQDYRMLAPGKVAYYDKMIELDLSQIECQIALPFHPSNTYSINELQANLTDILADCEKKSEEQVGRKLNLLNKVKDGQLFVDQGVIAGCSGGTFENLCAAADHLRGGNVGTGAFTLSAYPASQPVFMGLIKNSVISDLMAAGGVVKTAFCGPCFGAGDVPANDCLSIRHSTRNFPNREGSKPGEGQISGVALMDARSIAATAANGGRLTAATEAPVEYRTVQDSFDDSAYVSRVYQGFGKARPQTELRFGPNIADWPAMEPLAEDLLLKVAACITDPVTTTDELIPSGETSSYRSNPERLAGFALSRKCPAYVGKAKEVRQTERARLEGDFALANQMASGLLPQVDWSKTGVGTVVYANKPGDGSAREQAASCQKVLGTFANIAIDYATKRYRSNLINWGMIPFIVEKMPALAEDDLLYIPGIRKAVAEGAKEVAATLYHQGQASTITLSIASLTQTERTILLDGCLINHYRNNQA